MRTVFITGAGGFLGSRLLETLRAQGVDVVAGVRNRARKLAYERQDIKSLVCDVTDPINVARAIASVQPEGVIHLAGVARPADVVNEPLEGYQSIVTSWANVLDAVRRAVPRARVVLASACDVYGNAGADGEPLSEDTPLNPLSTFGSLKAAAENIAHTFYRDYHLNITIARPFHYTGRGQSSAFYFGYAARQIADWNGGSALRLPDLGCLRDLLHVDDVAAAYAALLRDGRPNETYNIATGEAFTCRELVQTMIAAANADIDLEELPADGDHPQPLCFKGDNTKITDDTSWQPLRTAHDAVRELLAGCQQPAEPVATH